MSPRGRDRLWLPLCVERGFAFCFEFPPVRYVRRRKRRQALVFLA